MGCLNKSFCCQKAQISIELPFELWKYYSGFVQTWEEDGKYLARFTADKPCTHFELKDGKGNCKIYEDRPEMCRRYPEPFGNLHVGCGYNKE